MYSQHPITQSDRELWLELKKGNKKALRTLFLRHHDSLFQYGSAICSDEPLIEDCLQELFFQLWNTRSDLSRVDKVKGYLWISFRRRLTKRLKKKQDYNKQFTSLLPGMQKESSIDVAIIRQEQQTINHDVLNKVVDTLTRREREIIFLKFYEGLSYPEIEEILEVQYQTARNYVYRAIKRLREALEKEEVKIVLSIGFFLIF